MADVAARAARERREAQEAQARRERQARENADAVASREARAARKAASDKRRCPMCVRGCFDDPAGHVCFTCGQSLSCCDCPPPPEKPLYALWWRDDKAMNAMKFTDPLTLLPLLETMWEQALFGSEDDGERIADDFYSDAAFRHAELRGTSECIPFGDWFPCDIEYGNGHNTVRRLVHRTTKEVVYTCK